MQAGSSDVQAAVDLALGRRTLAELTGLTAEQARQIAERGTGLAQAGRLEEARILFEGLVASNPRDDGAHAALGTLYEKLGRRDAALDSFDAALALCPEHPVARMGRGELRLRMGDLLGVEDVQRAALADPEGRTSAGRRAAGLLEVLREVGT